MIIANYYGINTSEIRCEYNESGEFTAKLLEEDGESYWGEFVFDDETGIATERTAEIKMDFLSGKIINQFKNEDKFFTDNTCLVIASIGQDSDEKVIEKYCTSEYSFYAIDELNLSDDEESYKASFLIIPKDNTVRIDVYTCKITEEGNVEPDEGIEFDINFPFILSYNDYESIMPHYGLNLRANGFEDFIPLSFSGYDGSIALSGHESEVKDITIYE